MEDFKGQTLRLELMGNTGWLAVVGKYVKEADGFLAISLKDDRIIRYYSLANIKSVEILKDEDEDE